IIEDNNGDIWAGTEGGISRINGHDFSIKTYQFSNVLQGNVYSEDCAVKLKDGRLLFGTNYGLTAITPEKEMQMHKPSNIKACITDVKVNGKSLYDKEAGNEELDMALNYMKCISLNHKENTIEISFSNFNYNSIKTSLYQYYLEGLSSDWHSSTTTNKVNYNNLAPGHYIFHLRTLNGSNKWSDETTLDINIEEPWYNTWMAWAVYILIAYAIGYYIYKGWKERFRLHQQLQIDQQLTEFRLNFFTHIAHEFRTPLAVIQGAVDKLSNSEGRNTSKSAIQTANRGTKRLLRLVNQLMEFRKVSTENIKLNVEHADLISFIRDIYQDFWPITRQKDISITFTPFDKKYEMLFDKHVVELIVYNIISNAVKYTPTKGKVSIKIIKDEQYHKICIICEDNGPGISEEQMHNLFQPFMHGYVSNGGMGIGLYTAHNMAKAHKGALTYNRVDAKGGSIFTFIFPDDDNVYSPEEYKSDLAVETKDVLDENANIEIREMLPASINDYTVAVIEDDPDMMEQIKNELSVYFNVEGYMNGQLGCEGVLKTHPVLLICDVMLPDMSGYEIVKKIKQDKEACHIPVIMLTALDDENHQIKGYEAGADDYMVKPCNFRILIVRAIQLIKWSIRLESEKTSNIGDSNDFAPAAHLTADSILTNKADKVFKEKVQHIISQHIEDTDFNVDVLASMMNMGRTKFYGKMRELTGISPNKYLSNERMRIAAELLLENELSISEISYKVGIQDASYFNKCFKAKYGVVPSKYGKS
ncbi:MAG: response regulator, partial [Prevotella sp.]|nr:response regulator [Prevotella sp.]